jgi:hypothetical protein
MIKKSTTPTTMMQAIEEDSRQTAELFPQARRFVIPNYWTSKIRFIPYPMPPDNQPFVRMARHCYKKAAIYCPQWTPKSWGGNPKYKCPVCDLANRFTENNSSTVKDIGYAARCKVTWLLWCIVLDFQDPRGKILDQSVEEILNPYEFEMTKTTWDLFKAFQKMAETFQKPPSPYLWLDLETGRNFLATGTPKGITLEPCDPAHIFDEIIEPDDPNWDKYMATIWAKIHKPSITLPTDRQLMDLAEKIEEEGRRNSGSNGEHHLGRVVGVLRKNVNN